MTNIYDQAHALAAALKQTEEYKEFQRLNDVARADDTNRALMDEYKRLQFRMQAMFASGERMEEDELKRLQQIGSLLQFNQDASAAMLAEMRFQRVIADIYKIIAEAAGIDLDMLR
ncbi:MAG: YlbF family regulator [Eubacteriales bacterium]|nr:YlbF family regulator [Eubacteriales bacterium]